MDRCLISPLLTSTSSWLPCLALNSRANERTDSSSPRSHFITWWRPSTPVHRATLSRIGIGHRVRICAFHESPRRHIDDGFIEIDILSLVTKHPNGRTTMPTTCCVHSPNYLVMIAYLERSVLPTRRVTRHARRQFPEQQTRTQHESTRGESCCTLACVYLVRASRSAAV